MPSTEIQNLYIDAVMKGQVKRYDRFGKVRARQQRQGSYVIEGLGGNDYVMPRDEFELGHRLLSERKNDFSTYEAFGSVYAFQYVGEPLPGIVNPGDYIYALSKGEANNIQVMEQHKFKSSYRQRL